MTGSNSKPSDSNHISEIDQRLGLSLSPHLIVAGSTAPGEEQMLLASFREVRLHFGLGAARLLLAPRRPERFDDVASMIGRSGFTFVRRSELFGSPGSGVQRAGGLPDVILLDTIGELAAIYRFAAVVFVGGSLVPRGGHNLIEPAAFAKPIIVGPHTENFRQIVSDFALADALVQTNPTNLTRDIISLLTNPEHARGMGERALSILLENSGATDCTVSAITKVITAKEEWL